MGQRQITLPLFNYSNAKMVLHRGVRGAVRCDKGQNNRVAMKNQETDDEENNRWPPWLKPMLGESFYKKCKLHSICPKFGCNRYCLDCMDGALCPDSIDYDHQGHRVLHIRKSAKHDVIKASDIQEYLDLTGIQSGTINRGKVVFLRKHTTRKAKFIVSEADYTNKCEACWCNLQEPFCFCSLSCREAEEERVLEMRKKAKGVGKVSGRVPAQIPTKFLHCRIFIIL
ncbi:hypothetical protein SO802_020718 [Lithocarpus litseifolius]|uniref:Uncharacterized protein n=1 Tax=Lithocarpus litseifolius TaxID=425828 RepID=A0AAW2CF80_9ROSI